MKKISCVLAALATIAAPASNSTVMIADGIAAGTMMATA